MDENKKKTGKRFFILGFGIETVASVFTGYIIAAVVTFIITTFAIVIFKAESDTGGNTSARKLAYASGGIIAAAALSATLTLLERLI